MKPLIGIENNKFQPIIRKVQNINVQLSPLTIKPAKDTVTKLLKLIAPPSNFLIQNINPGDLNSQQSTNNKTPIGAGF